MRYITVGLFLFFLPLAGFCKTETLEMKTIIAGASAGSTTGNTNLATAIGGVTVGYNAGVQPATGDLIVAGKVGIGVEEPKAEVDIAGWISLGGGASDSYGAGSGGVSGRGIYFPAGNSDFQWIYGEHDSSDNSQLIFHQGDNPDDGIVFRNTDWQTGKIVDYMKISRGGVGIGTTKPENQLTIIHSSFEMPGGIGSGEVGGGINIGVHTGSDLAHTDPLGFINFGGSNTKGQETGIMRWGGAAIGAVMQGTVGEEWQIPDGTLPSSLVFHTATTGTRIPLERMRIDKDGNVGIGTAAPMNKLQINAISNPDGDTTTYDPEKGGIYFSRDSLSHGITKILPTNVHGEIREPIIGLGGLLLGGIAKAPIVGSLTASGVYISGMLGVVDPVDEIPAVVIMGSKRSSSDPATSESLGDKDTVFQIQNSITKLMTIKGNGNVGIGTDSPDTKLDVASEISIVGHSYLAVEGGQLNLADPVNPNGGQANAWSLDNYNNDLRIFYNSGLTRLSIDSATGNVGIAGMIKAGNIGHGALVKKSVIQNIPANANTLITWDTEVYDTDNIHDPSVNNTRLVVPNGVSRVIIKTRPSTTTPVTVSIDKNDGSSAYDGGIQGYDLKGVLVTAVLIVAPGDYFTVRIFSASSSNAFGGGYNSWFSMEIVE